MLNNTPLESRIFHGNVTPKYFAQALMGEFNRGNFRAQGFGNDKHLIVQITTQEYLRSGGQTAISVTLKQVADGVAVQIGQQSWLGVAASIGQTLLTSWRNPWNLLNRLDDLAQDVESLQLVESIMKVIDQSARAGNASFELSERLKRIACIYCQTANPIDQSNCIACGAPLGNLQPRTCSKCGFVLRSEETFCPNCKQRV
jgi:hypothetical protein